MPMKNLAILASGSGSNAEAIALHFRGHSGVRVALILCNKAGAGVFDRALRHSICTHLGIRPGIREIIGIDEGRAY